jgi:hypothetical protein
VRCSTGGTSASRNVRPLVGERNGKLAANPIRPPSLTIADIVALLRIGRNRQRMVGGERIELPTPGVKPMLADGAANGQRGPVVSFPHHHSQASAAFSVSGAEGANLIWSEGTCAS